MNELPLLEDAFLRAQWHEDYATFAASPEANRLERRLAAWAERDILKETASEAAFLQRFFVETWGYRVQGATDAVGYTCRSPVDQAFDYLHEAFQSRSRDALTTPAWAFVSDMREFRLYSRLKGKAQCQRFVLVDEADDPRVPALLGSSDAAAFRRFVFWRLFQPDLLLAERGA